MHGICTAGTYPPRLRNQWQSFAELLVEDSPLPVREKLKTWAWLIIRAIFARGMGLNAVFADAPDRAGLTEDFIRNYHQFADRYVRMQAGPDSHSAIRAADFDFELFASGEYSRMLEREWQDRNQPI